MTGSRVARSAQELEGLREVEPCDDAILREATLLNLNWNFERFTASDVLATAQFAHYTRLEPARGDFGYLLFDRAGWVAVAWLLFLDGRDPGYGYLRDGVPELSVCVAPAKRRQGHGRRVLRHTLDAAKARGLEAVSLSVEAGNPARELYRQLGFRDAPDAALEGTMVLRLR